MTTYTYGTSSGIRGYDPFAEAANNEAFYQETGLVPSSSTPTTTQNAAPAVQQGPTAEQIQAQQDAAQRTALRGGVRNLVNSLTGVYDLLYGDLGRVAGDQVTELQKRYNTETGALTDQFNQELPKIGKAYAGQGLYDSSIRGRAENTAAKGFENQIAGIGQELEADTAKVGQALVEERAKIDNEKGGLQALLASLDQETDINRLTEIRNSIDQKLRNAQTAQATNKTQGEFAATIRQQAPTTDRTGQLKSVLTNIINGQAPKALKISTAQEIIGSSGLTDEEKNRLTSEFNAQV